MNGALALRPPRDPARSFAPGAAGVLRRQCACGAHSQGAARCEECNKQRLQRRGDGHAAPEQVPPIVNEVLQSSGQPLDGAARALLEPRLGHDFSAVRIHADSRAAESARAVSAAAYTVGRDIVFGTGQYSPGTDAGRRLLAHELTHVRQQGAGASGAPARALSIGDAHSGAEAEAERIARDMTPGQGIGAAAPAGVLQRSRSGFFSTIGGFFSSIFHGIAGFSDDSLKKYLKELDAANDIEGDPDSDDKARAIVGKWMASHAAFALTPKLKRLLILEMLDGYVSSADATGILGLLETAGDDDLGAIFGAGGVKPAQLLDALSDKPSRQRLGAFFDQHYEGGLQAVQKGQMQLRRTAPATPIVPPQEAAHGPNPADCMEPLCTAAAKTPAPRNDKEAKKRVDDWEKGVLACLRTGAPASGASHQAAILANEEGEIHETAEGLRTYIKTLGRSPRRYEDFLNSVQEDCSRKTKEVRVEFQYNVVFEDRKGSYRAWGYGGGDWASVETALAALPSGATWGSSRLIRFSREECEADDKDAQGHCVGHGAGKSSRTGGDTDTSGSDDKINIYEAGLGNRPYSRSEKLGLPATQQSIRHEVGHVIDAQIPAAEHERFFRDILPWVDYPWAWVNSPAGRPATYQAEREKLRTEVGMDEQKFTTWLASLQPGVSVKVGARTYTPDTAGTGGQPRYLSSIDASKLPGGEEFSYARTNRGDYIAEVYTFAVSRPDFLYGKLPAEQTQWLKAVVFKTPVSAEEWRRVSIVPADAPPELIDRLLHTYTWEQARAVLAQPKGAASPAPAPAPAPPKGAGK